MEVLSHSACYWMWHEHLVLYVQTHYEQTLRGANPILFSKGSKAMTRQQVISISHSGSSHVVVYLPLSVKVLTLILILTSAVFHVPYSPYALCPITETHSHWQSRVCMKRHAWNGTVHCKAVAGIGCSFGLQGQTVVFVCGEDVELYTLVWMMSPQSDSGSDLISLLSNSHMLTRDHVLMKLLSYYLQEIYVLFACHTTVSRYETYFN